MKIVITGGSGFVGQRLVEELIADRSLPDPPHDIVCFSRNPQGSERKIPSVRWIGWDPHAKTMSTEHIDGVDAVVHLAGEEAVGRRLTDSLKKEVKESRAGTARLLVDAMRRSEKPPRIFLTASGVNYYGPRHPAEEIDESEPPGEGFWSEICEAWEGAAREAPEGVRVVLARLGVVFDQGGGALPKLTLPFRLFVGGRIGDGRQIMSWIHREDVVRAFVLALGDETIEGPVNVTAPEPVSNAQLTRHLSDILHRPAPFVAPKFALAAALGDGAEPIVTGQRVVPRKLQEHGFEFHYPKVEPALRDALSE